MFSNYANLGGAVMSESAYAKVGRPFPNYHPPTSPSPRQRATTGWTSPHVIHEKMRQVNMSAVSLDGDITANVDRAAFKTSWTTWLNNWKAFFTKYQGIMASFGALTYTDELFQQTISYESQLVSWYDAYSREKTVDGKAMPPASGSTPVPLVPIPPSKEPPTGKPDEGLVIPWWGWALGAVAIAGAGYATYLYVQKARAIRRVLDERVVPAALQVYGGPAGGQMASAYGQMAGARDPYPGQPVVMAPVMSPIPPPYSRYPGT